LPAPSAGFNNPPPPHQRTFTALAQVCRWEPALLTGGQRGQLNQAEKKLCQHGVGPQDILAFGQWWEAHDWRGKRGDPPLPHQVRQEWGRFAHWRREHDTANGDLTAQVLANQARFQARFQPPPLDPDLAEAIRLWDEVKRELAVRLDRGNMGRVAAEVAGRPVTVRFVAGEEDGPGSAAR
jgi:hypothetical protein